MLPDEDGRDPGGRDVGGGAVGGGLGGPGGRRALGRHRGARQRDDGRAEGAAGASAHLGGLSFEFVTVQDKRQFLLVSPLRGRPS